MNRLKGKMLFLISLLTFLIFCLNPVVAVSVEKRPSDVLTKLYEVSDQLKVLSQYMGVTHGLCLHFSVTDASPREVFFQALRLKKNVSQLYFEIMGSQYTSTNEVDITKKNIQPKNVYAVISIIQRMLQQTVQHLKLKLNPVKSYALSDTQPSDVYQQLMIENFRVNQMLDEKVTAANVYEIATLAVHYAGRILNNMPGQQPVLKESAYEPNKKLDMVLRQQLHIVNILEKISKVLGLQMLNIEPTNCSQNISMANTQELAYMILSEITYIAQVRGISLQDIKSYYPGKKYISDVYQRNTMLREQLEQILKYVDRHPKWMKKK